MERLVSVLSFMGRLGRTTARLAGDLWKGHSMTRSGSSGKRASSGKARVRTSVHDGRKYVKSGELVESDKARGQMDRLREIINNKKA